MKHICSFLLPVLLICIFSGGFSGCAIWIDGGEDGLFSSDSISTTNSGIDTGHINTRVSANKMFPYEKSGNWWRYSANNGNQLAISVEATITDNGIPYYKVVFAEEKIDTTEDWFRNTARGIEFNSSLQGMYSLFFPSTITATTGSFVSGGSSVTYRYYPSLMLGGATHKRVVACTYSSSILHGFDVIYFADSLGIVSLVDDGGRFSVEYMLDSCTIDGTMRYCTVRK